MKKITVLILALLLCSCSKVEQTKTETKQNDILCFEVDMSGYGDSLDSQYYSAFKGINMTGIEDALNNKKDAVVLISYEECPNCQDVINDIGKYAKEKNVTIYYFNAIGEIDNEEKYDYALQVFDPILRENGDSGKTIFTPEIFRITNGEFAEHYIGTGLEDIYKVID